MLTPFSSQFITDTGISTGDEGKGRVILEIINELRDQHDDPEIVASVMKVNGGSNSGHTVAGLKLNTWICLDAANFPSFFSSCKTNPTFT